MAEPKVPLTSPYYQVLLGGGLMSLATYAVLIGPGMAPYQLIAARGALGVMAFVGLVLWVRGMWMSARLRAGSAFRVVALAILAMLTLNMLWQLASRDPAQYLQTMIGVCGGLCVAVALELHRSSQKDGSR